MERSFGRVQGKRAFVTGAGSGIGRAVAIHLAQEGARVGILGRRRPPLEATAEAIRAFGGESLVLPGDVSIEGDVDEAVGSIVVAWGGLDIVIGVAGIELMPPRDERVDRLDLSVWRQTIDVNLTGMFLTCKYGVRALLASGGGSVIVTGSPCGLLGFCERQHAYSASKAGTHGLVRVMAADYASEGIRVNGVIPGFIETPLTESLIADPERLARVEAGIPLGRAGRSEEVAPLFVWLASDEASYVTGAFFTADGGQTSV